jgi:hypothetical protein
MVHTTINIGSLALVIQSRMDKKILEVNLYRWYNFDLYSWS